ncbi:MarR family winged helix-turn-helix transcriptional regulator [Glycomyces sp. TRM65418]|uniref:MarR family winged helix-turn-helix transcriptional regulator n=1 Tax=Glycomyces sp. TRM65418 TaxID=2867006 RepID=UPI001CE5845E|nr:MarR family winged helix-turn-helix transcriptional regulator [Glycomyces sp. TRM65418]MCC3765479.1 MarR family winged helix-turn-helix transcriptional regulator [Glycomyces sp. TRM65418]QZD55087.1 MarR family winged helix-turn-helix transcriptional regulator [Glycomyces sp. TRM65418]
MSDRQALLSGMALTVFRLNGQFLDIAEGLARPAGLTAAHWQVLGAVLKEPLPVAGIARAMGITRQAVQRIADLLAANGMVEYRPNPAHRRAKLVAPTAQGLEAVERIGPAHAAFADRLVEALGEDRAAEMHELLRALSATLETLASDQDRT